MRYHQLRGPLPGSKRNAPARLSDCRRRRSWPDWHCRKLYKLHGLQVHCSGWNRLLQRRWTGLRRREYRPQNPWRLTLALQLGSEHWQHGRRSRVSRLVLISVQLGVEDPDYLPGPHLRGVHCPHLPLSRIAPVANDQEQARSGAQVFRPILRRRRSIRPCHRADQRHPGQPRFRSRLEIQHFLDRAVPPQLHPPHSRRHRDSMWLSPVRKLVCRSLCIRFPRRPRHRQPFPDQRRLLSLLGRWFHGWALCRRIPRSKELLDLRLHGHGRLHAHLLHRELGAGQLIPRRPASSGRIPLHLGILLYRLHRLEQLADRQRSSLDPASHVRTAFLRARRTDLCFCLLLLDAVHAQQGVRQHGHERGLLLLRHHDQQHHFRLPACPRNGPTVSGTGRRDFRYEDAAVAYLGVSE